MTFKDIFKKSFLEKINHENINTSSIVMYLGMAIILGLFIYLVYRFSSKSSFYNRGFNKSLAVLPVITAAIILAMGSSLTISLGMVGALSIVRFRNAIKDTVDLVYLFWSISVGIVVGAGIFELAIILSVCLALLVVFLDFVPALRAPCILVVSAEKGVLEKVLLDSVKRYAKYVKVRSRNVTKKGTEWILEVKVSDEEKLVENTSLVEGVSSVQLMTHDGDLRF